MITSKLRTCRTQYSIYLSIVKINIIKNRLSKAAIYAVEGLASFVHILLQYAVVNVAVYISYQLLKVYF